MINIVNELQFMKSDENGSHNDEDRPPDFYGPRNDQCAIELIGAITRRTEDMGEEEEREKHYACLLIDCC